MKMLRFLATLLVMASIPAWAMAQQAILQGGPWQSTHVPMYVPNGYSQPIVQDSGPAGGGGTNLGISELLLTQRSPTNTYPAIGTGSGPYGTNLCDYDAPLTNPTGYHFLCWGPNVNGAATIAAGAGGVASPSALNFIINGVTYPFPTTSSGAIPFVINNTALQALSTASFPLIQRLGFYAAGDAPTLLYTAQSSPCSLNSGAGDNGSQVRSANGGCWIATFPSVGGDIREWGAKFDGTTDATAALQAALSTPNVCALVPPSTSGFSVSQVTMGTAGCLRGTKMSPGNWTSGFAGSSWLKCVGAANTTCVTQASGDGTVSPGSIDTITLVGAPGTPNPGAIGYQMKNGYNTTLNNVSVFNFDVCSKWGPPESGLLGSHVYNLNQGRCATSYSVFDGMPEVYFYGGRWGMNGANNLGNTDNFALFTNTTAIGAGGGPNTIVFDGIQFNPGDGGGVACAFKWGGNTGSGGVQQVFKVLNSHIEYHTYTGSDTQTGVFCADSTVPQLREIWISNSDGDNGLTGPLFNFPSTVSIKDMHVTDTTWNCTATAINFSGSTSALEPNRFTNNTWCGNVHWTGAVQSSLFLENNANLGRLTIDGNWGNLVIGDNIAGGFVDNATGNIAMSGFAAVNYTPVVTFGGSSTGWAYAATGFASRTPNGGFKLHGNITFTAKGSATGNVLISGSPYICAPTGTGEPGGSVPTVIANAAGLTGGVQIQMTGTTDLNVNQFSATGLTSLTDANFTATTTLLYDVYCNKTTLP